MEFSYGEIEQWISAHLWPVFRIASFLMVVPIIGTQLVPMRIRLGFTLLLSAVVVPVLDELPAEVLAIEPLSLASGYVIFQQILVGVALGFLVLMFLQLFVISGQIMAMQMGLGFAAMVDPTSGVTVPVLSQFYLITVTLLFLGSNGHHLMIEVIVASFSAWPIAASIIDPENLWLLVNRISWLFASALLIALPVSASVFIVNVSFGIMTRAAPQLNVFALGFPIAQIFGMTLVYISLSGFLPHFIGLLQECFRFINQDVLGLG